MIGIADKLPVHDGKHELHRLLGTLLSAELPTAEKLGIMETEYSIPADNRIGENVGAVCNLSQGIFEKGEDRGKAMGEAPTGHPSILLNVFRFSNRMDLVSLLYSQTL